MADSTKSINGNKVEEKNDNQMEQDIEQCENKMDSEVVKTPYENDMNDDSADEAPPSPTQEMKQRRSMCIARRSSIGRVTGGAGRMSRSLMNIGFEDQVKAIDSKMDTGERLERLLTVVMSNVCRSVQDEFKDSSDDRVLDMTDELHRGLRMHPLLKNDTKSIEMNTYIEKLNTMKRERCDPQTLQEAIMPTRLKEIKAMTQKMTKEWEKWKEMFTTRKKTYLQARRDKKRVAAGEVVIDDSQRSCLSTAEDIYLRGVSDGRGELDRLKNQIRGLEEAQAIVGARIAAVRKRKLDEIDTCLNEAAPAILEVVDSPASPRRVCTVDSSDYAAKVQKIVDELRE